MANTIRQRRSELPGLQNLPFDKELKDIYGKLDGEDLIIHNEMHFCNGLRKIHLELATLGKGLQILHCVFFPDPRYDLPVFGVDLVAGTAGISAAIVDLSPVTKKLPREISIKLQKFSDFKFSQVRDLPAWGTIFSPYVNFIRPANSLEENLFLEVVDGYLNILISAISTANPDKSSSIPTLDRNQGQLHYCAQQKLNDKTRSVLSKAFNVQWADKYLNNVLFDNPAPS